jgi:hypothetical protein
MKAFAQSASAKKKAAARRRVDSKGELPRIKACEPPLVLSAERLGRLEVAHKTERGVKSFARAMFRRESVSKIKNLTGMDRMNGMRIQDLRFQI